MVTTEINHVISLLKGKAEMIIYFKTQCYRDFMAYVSEYTWIVKVKEIDIDFEVQT
jgi:cystathionine beta-lyase family protein involved in aluminum resistance